MRGCNALSDRLAGRRPHALPKISHADRPPYVACTRVCNIANMMHASRNASAVREPSEAELCAFASLKDILAWASIKGKPDPHYTQAGALLYAMVLTNSGRFVPRNLHQ